jgi:hypothetical protein
MLKIFTYAEQSLSLRDIFFLRILGQRLNVFSLANAQHMQKIGIFEIQGILLNYPEPGPEPKPRFGFVGLWNYFRLHNTVA